MDGERTRKVTTKFKGAIRPIEEKGDVGIEAILRKATNLPGREGKDGHPGGQQGVTDGNHTDLEASTSHGESCAVGWVRSEGREWSKGRGRKKKYPYGKE